MFCISLKYIPAICTVVGTVVVAGIVGLLRFGDWEPYT